MSDLARRAVACRHWRWMSGMCWIGSLSENVGRLGDVFSPVPGPVGAYLPDLTDPCTLGGLLSLVREAHPGRTVWIQPDSFGWVVLYEWMVTTGTGALGHGATEAEALIAALEAAP